MEFHEGLVVSLGALAKILFREAETPSRFSKSCLNEESYSWPHPAFIAVCYRWHSFRIVANQCRCRKNQSY